MNKISKDKFVETIVYATKLQNSDSGAKTLSKLYDELTTPAPMARTRKPPEDDGEYWIKLKKCTDVKRLYCSKFGGDQWAAYRKDCLYEWSEIEWRSGDLAPEPEWEEEIDG